MRSTRITLSMFLGPALFAITLIHRVILWHLLGSSVDATARANPDWLTWQYLPRDAYRLHFWLSLVYLQQTPPLPHLVFGVLLKVAEWPVGVAHGLYLVQALISATTAAVLFALLRRLRCGLVLSAAVALWFALSTDLYLLELASLGQLIYESGAMALVAAACLSLLIAFDASADRKDDIGRRHLITAGCFTALAALTRASFSLLFIPLALFVAIVVGMRRMAVFLVAVVLLQGAWCLKNALVFGYLTPATSSWSGINATQGYAFNKAAIAAFERMIVDDPSSYPPWFLKEIREHGYVSWSTDPAEYAPPDVLARDRAIQHRLEGTNQSPNSIATRLLSDQYLRAWSRFVVRNPGYFIEKVTRAYGIFWQPMASYTAMFVAPVFVYGSERASLFSLPRRSSPAFAMTGHRSHRRTTLVDLPTIDLDVLDFICLVAMHVVFPLALIVDAFMLGMRRPPLFLNAKLLLVGGIAWYGAILFNVVEVNENMRFRLSVEPEIIAFSVALLNAIVAAAWSRLAFRRSSATQ
jgi:hypothetical protein